MERRVYSYRGEGSDTRVDRWLGIADDTVSVGARVVLRRRGGL